MKAKQITVLGLLTAIALTLSFLESYINLSFIAPGVKIGLANCVTVFLVANKKYKSAAAVSLCRIVLSSLLFGTPITFLYAFLGFALSFTVMFLISKIPSASPFIISVFGGIFHNIGQAIAAVLIFGLSAIGYLPVLLLFGCVFGGLTGGLCLLLVNNKTIKKII